MGSCISSSRWGDSVRVFDFGIRMTDLESKVVAAGREKSGVSDYTPVLFVDRVGVARSLIRFLRLSQAGEESGDSCVAPDLVREV